MKEVMSDKQWLVSGWFVGWKKMMMVRLVSCHAMIKREKRRERRNEREGGREGSIEQSTYLSTSSSTRAAFTRTEGHAQKRALANTCTP
jgi:hypothetical protein